VKTGRDALSIVQVNYVFDKELTDPDQLLDRYTTLTCWSEALLGAGAGAVSVVQRFHRAARIARNGVTYLFSDEGAWPVARRVAAARADVAHVNGMIFPGRTWLLRRALPPETAIVVQNHSDGGAVGRAPLLRLLGRASRGAVDAYLFAALEHAAAWRDAGLIAPRQPIYQVMEASTSFRPLARDAARAASGMHGDPALLWVGRLTGNKDPLTVLDGFERAVERLSTATLTMIFSEADLVDDVRRRVNGSAALRGRVRLAGAVPHDQMPAFFSAADLYVGGSHHEGSGYALMEACACGAVPVVTDIPTFRLLTGGAGGLWPPGDAAACARALVEVSGRNLAQERAKLADHVGRELTWAAIGRRAVEIYEEVAARRARLLGAGH
jgi:glycosyltransferase involved in cell wall biosynthesis